MTNDFFHPSSFKKKGGHEDHPEVPFRAELFLVSLRQLADQCEQRQIHRNYDGTDRDAKEADQ